MKIVFVGLSPSPLLQKMLFSHSFSAETLAKPSSLLKDPTAPDLVAFLPKSLSQLSEALQIKKAFPNTWLALVIEKKSLRDPEFQNEFLKCEAKNEVWLKETWEETFWFSLQSALAYQKSLATIEHLKKECDAFKAQCEELSNHSKSLIEKLERDVVLASSIQRSILPKISPQIPGISIAAKYIPAAGLGGDYYDIFEFGDRKRYGLIIADSKTHGMAAALLSILVKVRLEEMKDRFPDSKTFVEFLNREIHQIPEKERASISLLYGILDRTSLHFDYTVAGNMKPVLWRMGEALPLPEHKNPNLGGMDHYSFKESSLSLKPGDLLIFHTDGLEAPITQGKKSASQVICEILKTKDLSPEPLDLQNELMALIDHHLEKQPLSDDLTLIEFSIHEHALYVASKQDS